MFGGTAGDTTSYPSHDQIAGKIVVLKSAPGGGVGGGRGGGGGGGRGALAALRALSDAVAVATVTDALTPAAVQAATHPREGDVMMKRSDATPGGQLTLTMTRAARRSTARRVGRRGNEGTGGQDRPG